MRQASERHPALLTTLVALLWSPLANGSPLEGPALPRALAVRGEPSPAAIIADDPSATDGTPAVSDGQAPVEPPEGPVVEGEGAPPAAPESPWEQPPPAGLVPSSAEPALPAAPAPAPAAAPAPARMSPEYLKGPSLEERVAGIGSPQNFAFELRFGPYRPEVDSRVEGSPYSDFYGRKARYLFGVELDWQALRIPYVGTLGPGVGWSYTRRSGPNQVPDGTTIDGEIAQSSSLAMMPMHAAAVLRIDALARLFSVPLVPFGKFGLGYTLWWVNDGTGIAVSDQGVKAKDSSTGTYWALGGMLLLDGLDPGSARQLDADSGVNNTYAFMEWSNSDVGGGNEMYVGEQTWVAGLAIEF